MDCIVHGITKSRAQLSDLRFPFTFLLAEGSLPLSAILLVGSLTILGISLSHSLTSSHVCPNNSVSIVTFQK